ncbi:MAG: Coenzyme F420 hydrogenase/dehydrogenase, beta subunit C-terminal domain [Bacteroidales bacterium]|nr:Coenzyme F420 hydrogenase/dehydrogenase, beta subunit C-terminal domain [Lachnoclostridium sp.]MCM1465674.1 Coenzyme F420 hydrogenase/dehydrogenase, beta subunit C-terminal domain [Bacteroidales bacterium]
MACLDVCPKDAIRIEDAMTHYNAVIEETNCVNCNACHKVCPNNHPIQMVKPMKWYQGWAKQESIRMQASSGGLASAIAYSFVEDGGEVCACVFKQGKFIFQCIDNDKELNRIAGSKYVKSNPIGIYPIIRQKLEENKKILFIGLPCQVAALKRFLNVDLQKNLYTIDLICHGTPSPKLLELFLQQYGYSLQKLKNIKFREKSSLSITEDAERIEPSGIQDRYMMGFLEGIFYTDNCYHCAYATLKRTGDITLGDSWGSSLPKEEKVKGISLILIQNSKGEYLLERAEVHKEDVDLNQAVKSNAQLQKPVKKTERRKHFFCSIQSGKGFNATVFRYCFKRGLKQYIKKGMWKLDSGGGNERLLWHKRCQKD